MKNTGKQKILIVDDNEMNRAILSDMLGDEFDILEAADGVQAVATLTQAGASISLVLLDIVMPLMDGYEVLAVMNKEHWIDDIPVIMISAESRSAYIERAYELGVSDFISRLFDMLIVRRRAINTIMLYAKQKKLVSMVADQIYEREKTSNLMINILSHIVEFRNGESGLHVLHIHTMTELLLKHLVHMTDQYPLSQKEISLISTASALHDIGKIGIADEILNKPGKLTKEEFEIIKTHSMIGASMLEELPFHQDEPLVKTAYEICRWHHERYDGGGYPDGLKGEEIPISAQIVSLADVYDALISERVYKKAYTHEQAMVMILGGECGAFNPVLLQCLEDIAETIRDELRLNSPSPRQNIRSIADEMLQHEELRASERTLQLLERERSKYRFFATMSQEIQFEYTTSPPMLILSEWGAAQLGLGEFIINPSENENMLAVLGKENYESLANALHATTPEQAVVQHECALNLDGEPHWYRIICRATWTDDDSPQYIGAIGKALDIHEEYIRMADLKYQATHDALTGLLNHVQVRQSVIERLDSKPDGKYAMVMFDLDGLKEANQRYGHDFGNQVLHYVAQRLLHSIRGGDIGARIGGDEFLIFLEYRADLEPLIDRIFRSLCGEYARFPIHVSMGVTIYGRDGTDYDTLLHNADRALYAAKREGGEKYMIYDSSMKDVFSVITPIESDTKKTAEDCRQK